MLCYFQTLFQLYHHGGAKENEALDRLETSNIIWDTGIYLRQMPISHVSLLWSNIWDLFFWKTKEESSGSKGHEIEHLDFKVIRVFGAAIERIGISKKKDCEAFRRFWNFRSQIAHQQCNWFIGLKYTVGIPTVFLKMRIYTSLVLDKIGATKFWARLTNENHSVNTKCWYELNQ